MNFEKLYSDFKDFSLKHISSKDIDPVYFVMSEVNKIQNLDTIQSIWRCLLYTAWYNLQSSELVLKENLYPKKINKKYILPTGVERRGFRGNNKAVEMINSFFDFFGSVEEYFELIKDLKGKEGWLFIRDFFEVVKGNGGWASYKWADLMKNVIKMDITANSIGGEKVSKHSPVECLSIITGLDYVDCKNIKIQEEFYDICKSDGIPFDGIEEMETSLCDFKSMIKGRYYIGRDIDEQLHWIAGLDLIWITARNNVFEAGYLGEISGWDEVRKGKLKDYLYNNKI